MQSKIELNQAQKHKLLNSKLNLLLARKKEQKSQNTQNIVTQNQKPKEMQIERQTVKPIIIKQNTASIQIKQTQEKESKNNIPRTKHIKKPQNKDKTILRKAAGEVWQDKTLQQWNKNDFRIFCGNLGNEVHQQLLGNSFRKYPSFQKSKVIRDKRTGKSKGYGFVSFSNPKDFLKALNQMNNKYIGSRPVKLTRSTWKQRNIDSDKNQQLPSDFTNFKKLEDEEKQKPKI